MNITINKKIIKWIIVFLFLFGLCDSYLRNIDRFSKGDYGVSGAVNTLLGIPGLADKGEKSELSKISEVLHISEEEWNTPACAAIDKLDCSTATKVGDRCKRIPVEGLTPLKECIDLSPAGISSQYCSHWNFNNCHTLSINDYILQRQDILDTMIKILEKPCHYLPTEEDLISKYKASEAISALIFDNARSTLNCDSKDKKPYTIILRVLDKHREKRFDIVIERKD